MFLNYNIEKNYMKKTLVFGFLILSLFLIGCEGLDDLEEKKIEDMVYKHARAWEIGDKDMLNEVLHEDVVFAYPGRRLNKEQTIDDLDYFSKHFEGTKVYIHNIIIDDDLVAVEWQFATTKTETGERQVVSDAIIGKVQDGKFIVWKEYLDGRVKLLQASGELWLEEGDEPYPWPKKTKNYVRK
jgi:ketosteroid isomerase-like protein